MTSEDPHRGWVRRDVANVRPLGAYAARSCPVVTQWNVIRPVEPAPAPTFLQRLGEVGLGFEAEVYEALAEGELVPVNTDPLVREGETRAAMERGDRLILGGRLPTDVAGRRVGEPDVLIRVGDNPVGGRWGYRPVDVKHHSMLVAEKGAAVVVVELDELRDGTGHPDDRDLNPVGNKSSGKAKKDLLQLAHYHRMLESCGHAVGGDVWAGVLASEGQVVWYRLDLPMWQTPATSDGRKRKKRTSLEVYDFEFGFRLDIAAVAGAHLEDGAANPLLVAPIKVGDCDMCRWRRHCLPWLERRRDVSLLPRAGWQEWQPLSAAGLDTIPLLAASTGQEVVDLPQPTLARLRTEARARLGDAPAYLRDGIAGLEIPRADIEIDLDMENDTEVYLWGMYVVDLTELDVAERGYRPVVDWSEDLDERDAITLFLRTWRWLRNVRDLCRDHGHSLAVYCWSGGGAEERWLRHYARLADVEDQIEDFVASEVWVDLERVWKDQLVTGHGTSLKTVAPLTGFAWSGDDVGGAQSMTWYRQATDPNRSVAERSELRNRLLDYNRDDVLATRHVREWMSAMTVEPL